MLDANTATSEVGWPDHAILLKECIREVDAGVSRWDNYGRRQIADVELVGVSGRI